MGWLHPWWQHLETSVQEKSSLFCWLLTVRHKEKTPHPLLFQLVIPKAFWIGRWTGLLKCHVLLEIDLLLIGFRQIRTDYSTTRQMPKRREMGGAWSAATSFPSLPRSIELRDVTQITKAEISDHQNGLILDHTPSAVPLLPCHARNTRQQSQRLLGNIRFIKQGRTDIGKAMKY